MTIKVAAKAEKEKLFEFQVRRRRLKTDGTRGYESFWKLKTVREAMEDGDQEFRCKDCHGPVKLSRNKLGNGSEPFWEHKSRQDAEYCPAAVLFQGAKDGRAARLSAAPVL